VAPVPRRQPPLLSTTDAMETAPTTIIATEATCPACGWTTLHRWSVAAIGAAAAHCRGAHPELWQQHFYFPQDGFDHFANAWQPHPVTAVHVDSNGQLALFDAQLTGRNPRGVR